MLKLTEFDVDESIVVTVKDKKYIIDYVPALVDILLLTSLTDQNLEKAFYYLFKNTDLDTTAVPTVEKIKVLRNLRPKEDSDEENNKDNDKTETKADLTQLLGFLSLHLGRSRNELLTQYTLIELFILTNSIKAKEGYKELPFFETYKKISSIKDFASLL